MAEIIQEEKGAKGGKKRPKKHSTNIDMTPMVDLMCLLITFFMLTTAFSKPKVMEIVLPEKNQKDSTKVKSPQVPAARTLNIILGKKAVVYWYIGIADPNKPPLPVLNKTDFSKDGIRKALLDKNKDLFKKIYELKEKFKKGELAITQDSLNNSIKKLKSADDVGPIVLIKATEDCKYKDFVDIIDEMAIANIARYAVVDMNSVEKDILSKLPQ